MEDARSSLERDFNIGKDAEGIPRLRFLSDDDQLAGYKGVGKKYLKRDKAFQESKDDKDKKKTEYEIDLKDDKKDDKKPSWGLSGNDWRRNMIERGQNPFANSTDKGIQPKREQERRYQEARRQMGFDQEFDSESTQRFAGQRLGRKLEEDQM